jgi:hypothetical protein
MKGIRLHITAECERDGTFTLERKPRQSIRMSSGQIQSPYYEAIVCPKCRMWGKITEQIMVGDKA